MDTTPAKPIIHVTDATQLGRAVAALREELGWTQAELAAWTGLNRTYLSGLESDRATTAIKRLLIVITTLGYEITLSPKPASDSDDW